MQIRPLERSDVRKGFRCGEPSLDVFIERYAWQNQTRHHLGITYVAIDDATRRVVGYFTLAAASLSNDSGVLYAPDGYEEIPVIRIGRLAVDRRVQGIGMGAGLVHAALTITLGESERIGCTAAVVDALPAVVPFYERFGFKSIGRPVVGGSPVRPRPVPMYLGVGRMRKALG
ncbi:MAG: GNAT family N-acetyltransferase [Coriobacteriia bacterium]|nr:GNAT family N-acetyltransferase [Coriobacteriia bacterium]